MQASVVSIRQADRMDIPAILALYESAGITGEQSFSVSQAEHQFQVFLRYPFHRVYVATMDDKLVGTYELIIIDNLAKAGAKTAIVEDVAVDPTIHKQGIGKKMMLHARKLAKENGAYKLALSSNNRRREAHAFYEALGFERHGVSFVITP